MNKLNLVPVDDKIIIKPLDPESISSGGVYLPEGAQPEATSGTVVAVGPGLKNMAAGATERWTMFCEVGDIVYYPKFGAHKFELDDIEYVVIREVDLLAIRKKDLKDFEVDKDELKKAIDDTSEKDPLRFSKYDSLEDKRKLLLDDKK